MADCSLCTGPVVDRYRLVGENDYAYALVITSPVNATHQVIAPKGHKLNMGGLTPEEAKGVMDLQWDVQRRLMELFPDHPPVISIQTGKLSTVPHIHWQAYSSDAHIRQLYAQAHVLGDTPIGGYAPKETWKTKRTHPTVPGVGLALPRTHDGEKNDLESFLGEAAQVLRGSGDVERDRRRLKELTHELLRYNGFEI